LYFIDLRVQVRGIPQARVIVDRCLGLLTEARIADAQVLGRLEAEVEVLRRLLGPPAVAEDPLSGAGRG
jgi:hypothetical protein